MTVSSTTTKVSYAGNGSTTAFSAPFYFILASDLKVTLRSATGSETVKTLTTDYTVSGAGVSSGGTVTMLSPPVTGETLVIQRNVPLTQEVDYQANDPFPANTHEQALDKLTMETQQLNESVARSIKISTSNTIGSTEFTTNAATRANKVLGFDATGELSVTQALGSYRGSWATSTAYLQRDLVKDASNNNVYICVTAHTSTGSTPISSNTDLAKWALLVDARALPRTLTFTTAQTAPYYDIQSYDVVVLTNQTSITSMSSAQTGSPTNGQKLWISITGASAVPITWGSLFEGSTVPLPTSTIGSNRLDVGFIWNTATTKWRCIGTV